MHGPPIRYNNESVKRDKSSRKLLRNGTLKLRNPKRSFDVCGSHQGAPRCVEAVGGGEEGCGARWPGLKTSGPPLSQRRRHGVVSAGSSTHEDA
ncbi:hypothetical protein O3P69_001532 [Scylla paramamosain]|uniref:Uncharacterized protein n=1 Tax=Scylla paramamosain TaxID=85552 RepID=A0AAW0V319_SCYPA